MKTPNPLQGSEDDRLECAARFHLATRTGGQPGSIKGLAQLYRVDYRRLCKRIERAERQEADRRVGQISEKWLARQRELGRAVA